MESSVHVVHARDLDVHVQAVGAGPPLVVVGGPQLGHQYMRPLDALAEDFRLVYYDARGSGRTDIGDASLSFSGAVEDLEALRQALELDRFSLLGHSLGGHVAYLYASRHPERMESLILVDVGPPLDEELGRRFWSAMESRRSTEDEEAGSRIRASAEFQSGEPAALERFMKNLYGPFFRDSRTPEESDWGFTPITAANVLEYEERLMGTLDAVDPIGSLGRVECRTLVVHGEADPIPWEFGKFIADRITGAKLVVIPGASHFPFVEDRAAFLQAIEAFRSA
ncbi:MAG TPA: alpha/beta hydrolase [Candidatus Limnocylindria bacterium]